MMKLKLKNVVESAFAENPHVRLDDVILAAKRSKVRCSNPVQVKRAYDAYVRAQKKLNGVPLLRNHTNSNLFEVQSAAPAVEKIEIPEETPEERNIRIRKRFDTLSRLAKRLVDNQIPSLVVSGPPGLGKSYTIEMESAASDKPYQIISGSISGPGLLIALWDLRDGGTLVLDDCDDVFRDESCLNILKAVLDSNEKRVVSYRKLAKWLEDMDIPQSFEFKGSVAFCTNIDFEREIQRGSRLAPHFRALMDRSLYLSLTLRGKEDYLTRIFQVAIEEKLLENKGLDEDQAMEAYVWIEEHSDRVTTLSIRLAMQVASCMMLSPETWLDDVAATQLRTI